MRVRNITKPECDCSVDFVDDDAYRIDYCPPHARAADMRELIRRYKDSHELTTGAPYWKVCTCGWCEQARALLEQTR